MLQIVVFMTKEKLGRDETLSLICGHNWHSPVQCCNSEWHLHPCDRVRDEGYAIMSGTYDSAGAWALPMSLQSSHPLGPAVWGQEWQSLVWMSAFPMITWPQIWPTLPGGIAQVWEPPLVRMLVTVMPMVAERMSSMRPKSTLMVSSSQKNGLRLSATMLKGSLTWNSLLLK